MKKLAIMLITALTGLVLLAAPPASALVGTFGATSSEKACDTLKELNPDAKGCGAADGGVNKIIKLALNLLSVIAGIIAVIMIIIAGLKYVTSQGDANSISSAKNSLIYAIVGLVIVAFAQALVLFVLRKSTSA